MPNYKATIRSGDILEIEMYYSLRAIGKKVPRGKNQNLSTEQQQELNSNHAKKKLSRLINANFGKGDLLLTLTYEIEPTEKEAKKELQRYLRRVRNHRKKKGLPELKYIAVTEMEKKRIHHHIVMSALSLDDATAFWKLGRVISSLMDPRGDYTGLAHYIQKESRRENKKRWQGSRNLEKPKIEIKEVKRDGPLKAPKGYKVIQQQSYFSEVTGKMQYMRAIRIGGTDYATGKSFDSRGTDPTIHKTPKAGKNGKKLN